VSDCKTLSFLELPLTKVIYIIKIYFRQMLLLPFSIFLEGIRPFFAAAGLLSAARYGMP
jgi:hypothetical protein